jgi:squalene-hopene/tetraprenyl-beta-curcumene cyclase
MNPPIFTHPDSSCLKRATDHLLQELEPEGCWTGELSSSALSTATALIALAQLQNKTGDTANRRTHPIGSAMAGISPKRRWRMGRYGPESLKHQHNGFVVGPHSDDANERPFSNRHPALPELVAKSLAFKFPGWETYLARTIPARYGRDRTFSVPILTACILAGRLGADGWDEVPPLPFEWAALPHSLHGALQLPVVSYALPP